jgi:chromosome partitioning protein
MEGNRIISIVNHKGGSGKTTTAVNMGVALGLEGYRVLLVDWDPQANLTFSFGIENDHKPTIVDIFYGNATAKEVMIETENVHVLPASIQLADLEYSISRDESNHSFLAELLKDIEDFDFILIDCPPSLSILTLNALYASKEVIIPAQMEPLSVKGIELMINSISQMQESVNPDLSITGVLSVMVDSRKSLNKEVNEYIKSHLDVPVFEEVIRTNVKISEAPSFGESVITYQPNSNGARDYQNFTKAYLTKYYSKKTKHK